MKRTENWERLGSFRRRSLTFERLCKLLDEKIATKNAKARRKDRASEVEPRKASKGDST